MSSSRPSEEGCLLCGRAIPAEPRTDEDGHSFCCDGCRTVHETLGDRAGDADAELESGPGSTTEGEHRSPAGRTQCFLHVDGMHGVTCEAFLESVAEGRAGVTAAEGSYVTETLRVEYDPDRTSPDELCEAVSVLGYDASPRDDAGGRAGPGGRGGADGRDMGDLLGFRYAAGVVFASFMLLPYLVLVYPAHLSSLLDWPALARFEGGAVTGGANGLLVLPFFLVMTGVVLFFTGAPLLRGAYVSLRMRRPNTDLLVSTTLVGAYLYSAGAVLLGRMDIYFDLTLVVAATVVAATFYESLAKRRAVDELTDLTVSEVESARLLDADGSTETVAVEDLEPGDRVLVRHGERIPVDGVLAEGECTVDEAVMTGESLPVGKRAGDDVIGGSVVTADAAVIAVGDRATSSIDRLMRSVWHLQSANHGVQRRANRLAGVVVPAVLAVAVLAGVGRLALGAGLPGALLTFLLVLVAATPWALGLATPLSVATSIEEALRRGIVVFDETVFERLRDVDVVVFDKTGTLTTGRMTVLDADAPPALLSAAVALERRAPHPAAEAIVTAFGPEGAEEAEEAETVGVDDAPAFRADGGVPDEDDRGAIDGADRVGPEEDEGTSMEGSRVSEFTHHSTGVEGVVDGVRTLVGHPDLFVERGWTVDADLSQRATEARDSGRLPVLVGRDGDAEGLVVVGDRARDGWTETVTRLGERGVEVVVLTGDDRDATDPYEDHPHVAHVFAGVPADGKTATIRRLQADGSVAMVGDGTNDAPALARADLGIALGGGTALASDAADVAIVEDDLAAVETAFDLARAARRRVGQNNALALVYNVVAIPLAVVGLLNPLTAMLAVVACGGLVAANSFRALLDE